MQNPGTLSTECSPKSLHMPMVGLFYRNSDMKSVPDPLCDSNSEMKLYLTYDMEVEYPLGNQSLTEIINL